MATAKTSLNGFFQADDDTAMSALDELLSFGKGGGGAAAAPTANATLAATSAAAPTAGEGAGPVPASAGPAVRTTHELLHRASSSSSVARSQRELEAMMGTALAGLSSGGNDDLDERLALAASIGSGGADEPPAGTSAQFSNKEVHPGAFAFDLWAPLDSDASGAGSQSARVIGPVDDDANTASAVASGEADNSDDEGTVATEAAVDVDELLEVVAQRDSRIAVLEAQLAVLRAQQQQQQGAGSASGASGSNASEVNQLRADLATLNVCLSEMTARARDAEEALAAARAIEREGAERARSLASMLAATRADSVRHQREKADAESALAAAHAERAAVEAQLEAAQTVGQSERDAGASMALQRRLAEFRVAAATHEGKIKKYRRMLVTADTELKAYEKFSDALLDRARILARRLAAVYARTKDPVALAKTLYVKLDYDALAERLPNVLGTLELRGKAWSDRYIIMKDNFWFAFKSKSGAPALVIRLDTSVVEPCAGDPKLANAFRIRTDDAKESIWRAKTESDLALWVECTVRGVGFLSLDTLKRPVRTAFFAEGQADGALADDLPSSRTSRTSMSQAAAGAQSEPSSAARLSSKPYTLVNDTPDTSSKRIAAL